MTKSSKWKGVSLCECLCLSLFRNSKPCLWTSAEIGLLCPPPQLVAALSPPFPRSKLGDWVTQRPSMSINEEGQLKDYFFFFKNNIHSIKSSHRSLHVSPKPFSRVLDIYSWWFFLNQNHQALYLLWHSCCSASPDLFVQTVLQASPTNLLP